MNTTTVPHPVWGGPTPPILPLRTDDRIQSEEEWRGILQDEEEFTAESDEVRK